MIARRGFLKTLATAFGVATMDQEKLLWVPGKKLISIPKPVVHLPRLPRLANQLRSELIYEAHVLAGTTFPGQALSVDDVAIGSALLDRVLDSLEPPPLPVKIAPPGYFSAIRYNLAVELSPYYLLQPNTLLTALAREFRRSLLARSFLGLQLQVQRVVE